MLLILFNIRTRRVVLLQILWPSQFTQTWPKRCRVRRHFDEVSCRYPRTLYHCDRWMLKVISCGRKCAANKLEPSSAHDRRHIMTSPRYTGISRRDMQTGAPEVYGLNVILHLEGCRLLILILILKLIHRYITDVKLTLIYYSIILVNLLCEYCYQEEDINDRKYTR